MPITLSAAAAFSVITAIGGFFTANTFRVFESKVLGLVADYAGQYLRQKGIIDIEGWTINNYIEDLTEQAKQGKLHEAIAREEEFKALFSILSRNTKANVCLTGEAGVGKTALVEGLAVRIANGDVPDDLKNARVLKVKTIDLVVGVSGDGSALPRFRALFDMVERDKENGITTILYFDEFHQMKNFAELCKQRFDRDKFKCIAATTTKEYDKYIGPDEALARRFAAFELKEPNQNQTLEILTGLKERITQKCGADITDDAIKACVELTGRYMRNRTYPDKAIDMAEAAIKFAVSENRTEATEEDVKRKVEEITKVPITTVTDEEKFVLDNLESIIKLNVVGQDEAVQKVCDAVRISRMDLADPNRPRGSFIFTGSQGVGKTELANVLGKVIGRIHRIDLSQVKGKSGLYKLAFSGTDFQRDVANSPYSVVLFDNIDNANAEVLNIVSSLIETGEIKSFDDGSVLDFRNTFIILAGNIGSELIENSDNVESCKTEIIEELKKKLGKLVSIVDDTIVFNRLNKDSARAVIKNSISRYKARVSGFVPGLNIEFEESVYDYLVDIGLNAKDGARGLETLVAREIGKEVTKLILSGELKQDSKVVCTSDGQGIKFEIK